STIHHRDVGLPDTGMAVAVIRGGTSRGVFFREADLSGTASEREAAILRAFGGGDGAGILADGLGGENPGLRKVAIGGAAPQAALPLGEPLSRIEGGKNGSAIRCTVVDAVNRYLFIASEDVGAPDPLAPAATAPETFDIVDALVATVTARLRARGSDGGFLKVCLVQASSDNSIRARILYPDGRRSHPSFAVTGAVAVAVAASVPGTLLHFGQSQLAV